MLCVADVVDWPWNRGKGDRVAKALTWKRLRMLAAGLSLPGISEAEMSCGPCLLAHGELWTWWDRKEGAVGLRLPPGERPFGLAAAPEVFFVTQPIMRFNQVLARPDLVSRKWVQGHLLLSWRALAPKLFKELFPGEGPPVPSFSLT